MKKTILIFTLAFSFLIVKAQLNPVSHVTYGDVYGYPSYPNCPNYNCIKLTWSAPAASVTDTLVGYNIYIKMTFFISLLLIHFMDASILMFATHPHKDGLVGALLGLL
jgi:hypothetical protein